MGKYFGTDGIRGKAEMFTGEFIERVARGLGVAGKRVMIGGDTRESTERILEELEHSLDNGGASEVGNVGVLSTPGINFAFYYLGYDFAIDVTASHNPYTDNGIKIFERGEESGIKLSLEGRERIEKSIADDSPQDLPMPTETNYLSDQRRALNYYEEHLLQYVGETDFAGMKVVLDCANGATGVIGGRLFEKLGAEVVVINNDVSFGTKINDGVGSTHIEGLVSLVREGGFDFGVAFDGDGDRCMMVDENGEVVDGDQLLAILAEQLELSKIVTTVMANQGLLNWGQENGVEVITTDVGDQNVAAEMRARGIKLGGEQSGHIILPGEAMGDGMLTALVVAKTMKKSGKKLSELTQKMKKLPQSSINIPASIDEKELFKTEPAFKHIIEEYGQKLKELDGRVLVRPSGTENLIRVTVWGGNQDRIDEAAKELANKITEELKNGHD
ncbi:phosphoglucosamine mutase [Candidatus Saccharibacteria bacterium]|nr:phosphoglucosamine mutase [Candidatus Saccharibacteria bacterium]